MEASATLRSKLSHLRNPAGAEAWSRLSVRRSATLEALEELKRHEMKNSLRDLIQSLKQQYRDYQLVAKVSQAKNQASHPAQILMFDSMNRRTCLHYATCYGHSDCLGFARFVNVRDVKGATPLYIATKQGQPACVLMLLDKGALVCASTGDYGLKRLMVAVVILEAHRSTWQLVSGGCLESMRVLLAWGADRLQMDSSGFEFISANFWLDNTLCDCIETESLEMRCSAESILCIEVH
ncbi:Putative E3 ubiquitin-protein ligase XBAT31 [Apostasia shenzhenica]|uniref:E3 ubiquitin-protein ligase XBAT31 n=1 Tax=Apostasia shenzhenica TaxID=1088818 RepID=A0A2I0AYZ9_9ASPA|nr:Putative E3 ubiquitin-protein ligase XBAT31 [Apostasia shenzhenica]